MTLAFRRGLDPWHDDISPQPKAGDPRTQIPNAAETLRFRVEGLLGEWKREWKLLFKVSGLGFKPSSPDATGDVLGVLRYSNKQEKGFCHHLPAVTSPHHRER